METEADGQIDIIAQGDKMAKAWYFLLSKTEEELLNLMTMWRMTEVGSGIRLVCLGVNILTKPWFGLKNERYVETIARFRLLYVRLVAFWPVGVTEHH